MKNWCLVFLALVLGSFGLTGCVTSDGGGYSNQGNPNMYNGFMDGMQRKQQIINASLAERDAARASGRMWTRQDEQRRINELNAALQQNGLDSIRQMQGQ